MSKDHWRRIRTVLRYAGVAALVTDMALLWGTVAYYRSARPPSPHPEHGWVVRLNWSHTFGTASENNLLLWLFWWQFPFFGLIALGEAIRIYKIQRRPWDDSEP